MNLPKCVNLRLVCQFAFAAVFAFPASSNYRLQEWAIGGAGSDKSQSPNYQSTLLLDPVSGDNQAQSDAYQLNPGLMFVHMADVAPAPTVTNDSQWYNKLKLVLNPGPNPQDATFAVAVSTDGFVTTQYVQSDNTLANTLGAEDWRTYTDWGAAGQTGYLVQLSNTGRLEMYVSDGTDQLIVTAPLSTAATTNRWHHFTAVYDDDSVANTRIFLNGMDTQAVHTGTLANVNSLSNARPLTIGAASVPQMYFDGKIDQIAIYNYARTPAQIAWDYKQGRPIAWYKFDECQGTTVNDSSGNDKNATIVPGPSGNTAAGTCVSGNTNHMWYDGASGKINASLGFDGTDDYVSLTTPNIINTNSDSRGSIAFWMQPQWDSTTTSSTRAPTGTASGNTLFGLAFCGSDGACTGIANPGDLVLGSYNSGVTQTAIHVSNSNFSWSSGEWVHITFTWDDTLATNDLRLYLNGIEPSHIHSSEGGLDLSAMTMPTTWYIDDNSAGFNNIIGKIDDYQIFNYVLNPQQVRNLVNQNAAIRFGQ